MHPSVYPCIHLCIHLGIYPIKRKLNMLTIHFNIYIIFPSFQKCLCVLCHLWKEFLCLSKECLLSYYEKYCKSRCIGQGKITTLRNCGWYCMVGINYSGSHTALSNVSNFSIGLLSLILNWKRTSHSVSWICLLQY